MYWGNNRRREGRTKQDSVTETSVLRSLTETDYLIYQEQ